MIFQDEQKSEFTKGDKRVMIETYKMQLKGSTIPFFLMFLLSLGLPKFSSLKKLYRLEPGHFSIGKQYAHT